MKINLVWPFAILATVLFIVSLSPAQTARTFARVQVALWERFSGLRFAHQPLVKVSTRSVRRNELGSLNIKGSVTNKTGGAYRFLAVQYAVLDRDGRQVGTTRDILLNVGPGATVYFEMDSRDARGVRARLDGTVGW